MQPPVREPEFVTHEREHRRNARLHEVRHHVAHRRERKRAPHVVARGELGETLERHPGVDRVGNVLLDFDRPLASDEGVILDVKTRSKRKQQRDDVIQPDAPAVVRQARSGEFRGVFSRHGLRDTFVAETGFDRRSTNTCTLFRAC